MLFPPLCARPRNVTRQETHDIFENHRCIQRERRIRFLRLLQESGACKSSIPALGHKQASLICPA